MQKVSILFWLNRSKNNHGKAPIYCRITVDGIRAPELSTGKFLETTTDKEGNVKCKRWDYEVHKKGKKIVTNDQKVLGFQEDAILINRHLTEMKNKIQKIYDDIERTGDVVSANKIHAILTGRMTTKYKLLECYKAHIKRVQELTGKDYTETTAEQTQCRYNNVERFIKEHYKTDDVYLSQVNREFLDSFVHWGKIKSGYYGETKKRIISWNHNSAMKQLVQLKVITDQCLNKKWMSEDPFNGYSFNFDRPKFKFLTEDEIKIIEEKEMGIERLQMIKDIFLFCCYTSLEYSAVHALCEDHLVIGVNGSVSIMKERKKTGESVFIPLLDKAKKILDKYKDNVLSLSRGRIFPVCSNGVYNAYLKEIAALCGIKKNLTTHVARHTAATFLLNNGVSEISVCEIMGITSKVLKSTYGKILKKTVQDEMMKLQDRLSNV